MKRVLVRPPERTGSTRKDRYKVIDHRAPMRSRMEVISMKALLFALLSFTLRAQDPLTVTLPAGQLHGAALSGGAVFKGIPFAQPPVGDLRWREPMPVNSWKGVRDATKFSSRCVQG